MANNGFFKTLLMSVLTALIFCLLGCDMAADGGGSEMPNEVVAGTLTHSNAEPAAGAEVGLRKVTITPQGSAVAREWTVSTNAKGEFVFQGIPDGRYVLFANDTSSQKSVLKSGLEVQEGRSLRQSLTLRKSVEIQGRVLLPDFARAESLAVFIPGFTHSHSGSSSDSAGVYHLKEAPQGEYEIAFAYGSTINSLVLSIDATADGAVYMRDLGFTFFRRDAAGFIEKDTLVKSGTRYYVVPMSYRETDVPAWYSDKDFAAVSYRYPGTSDMVTWTEGADTTRSVDYAFTGLIVHGNLGVHVWVETGDTISVEGVPGSEGRLSGDWVLVGVKPGPSPFHWELVEIASPPQLDETGPMADPPPDNAEKCGFYKKLMHSTSAASLSSLLDGYQQYCLEYVPSGYDTSAWSCESTEAEMGQLLRDRPVGWEARYKALKQWRGENCADAT